MCALFRAREFVYFSTENKIENISRSRIFQLQYDSGRVTLLIPETQIHNAGTYILSARNSAGVAFCSCDVAVQGRLPNDIMADSENTADAGAAAAPTEPAPVEEKPAVVVEVVQPAVQSPLKDVSVGEGDSAQLHCVITGQPEPEVIWYHNGQPVKESADVQLLFQDDRCSLVLQETVADDDGEYKVVAINSGGEASSQCKLTVVAKPEPEPAQNATVEEATEQHIIVQDLKGQGADEEEEYEEIEVEEEEEEEVEEVVPSQTAVIEEDATQAVLVVDDGPAEKEPVAKIEDAESTEEETEEEEDDDENVLTKESVAPQFEKLLSDILADENDTVTFEVIAIGEPAPSIKWFLNNNELSASDRVSFSKTNDVVAKLVIKNVAASDKGVYTVKAINSCGEAKCFSHLIVKSINAPENLQIPDQQQLVEEKQVSPSFKEKFFDVIANIDESVKFEAIVSGKPTPKIKWLYNDRPVQGQHFLVSTTGSDRQVLTIPEVTHDCVGKISCVAENDAGKAVCVAYLTLIGDPSAPTPDQSKRYFEEQTSDSHVSIKRNILQTSQVTNFQSTVQNGYAPIDVVDAAPELGADGVPKGVRKQSAPRFLSALLGKIVDQGSHITLVAIADGYPVPEITVSKNGDTLIENENVKITHSLNKVVIEIPSATAADAGRYSCTATNAHGSTTSAADVVVKSKCARARAFFSRDHTEQNRYLCLCSSDCSEYL